MKLQLNRNAIRVGFVPLVDCAPLVVASELKIFERYGLHVTLSREIGWATVRDKLVYGEIDAAHALAPMLFAANAGLGCAPTRCESGLILNTHGNAITLSEELWNRGVRQVQDLARVIRESRAVKIYTLGVVFAYSSHHFFLRRWLQSGGIDPDRDVRIVVVPPPQMASNLANGTLDGYCVGEPWNSLAVQAGAGWCPVISRDVMPMHPEKILMVRGDFVRNRADEHEALIRALLEACQFCQDPRHHDEIVSLLSKPGYVNAPSRSIRNSLIGPFQAGHGRKFLTQNFHIFHHVEANRPTMEKAEIIVQEMIHTGLVAEPRTLESLPRQNVFRPDLFDQASEKLNSTPARRTYEKPDYSRRTRGLVRA